MITLHKVTRINVLKYKPLYHSLLFQWLSTQNKVEPPFSGPLNPVLPGCTCLSTLISYPCLSHSCLSHIGLLTEDFALECSLSLQCFSLRSLGYWHLHLKSLLISLPPWKVLPPGWSTHKCLLAGDSPHECLFSWHLVWFDICLCFVLFF